MHGSLADNALFSGVAAAELVRVLPAFRVQTVPRGTVLYDRGRPASHVFLVMSGSVAVIQRTGDVDTTVAVLGAGEFTGERALLQPATEHAWTAVCCEETRIAVAAGEALFAAIGTFPAIGVNVARGVHRRMRDASVAIDDLIADQ
jgi:voltage-gated potassium channel